MVVPEIPSALFNTANRGLLSSRYVEQKGVVCPLSPSISVLPTSPFPHPRSLNLTKMTVPTLIVAFLMAVLDFWSLRTSLIPHMSGGATTWAVRMIMKEQFGWHKLQSPSAGCCCPVLPISLVFRNGSLSWEKQPTIVATRMSITSLQVPSVKSKVTCNNVQSGCGPPSTLIP